MTGKRPLPQQLPTTDAARLEALIPHLQGSLGKKPEHVVDLLKIWRTNGLSVTDVAEAVGVVRKTLRYWSMGLSAGGRDWPALRELMDAEGLQRITPALEASSASAGSSVHLHAAAPRVDSHRTPRARVEDDGTLVIWVETRIRPGEPGYVEALRRALRDADVP